MSVSSSATIFDVLNMSSALNSPPPPDPDTVKRYYVCYPIPEEKIIGCQRVNYKDSFDKFIAWGPEAMRFSVGAKCPERYDAWTLRLKAGKEVVIT